MMMKQTAAARKKITISLMLAMMLGSVNLFAQDDKFGADPDKCKENLSLYREYYKQKNYDDAMMGWRWVFANCPKSSKNIYIDGPKLIKHEIEKHETDKDIRQAYIDTLMLVYDQRIEIYPSDKGSSLGRKGMDQYSLAEDDFSNSFNTLTQSLDVLKEKTDPYYLMRLYQAGMKLLIAKKLEMDAMYDLYDRVSGILDLQSKNFNTEESKGSRAYKKLTKAEDMINQNFERIAKEDQYVELMKPKVASAPDDAKLLEKVTNMMVKRKWTSDPFYLVASEKLYKLSPTSNAAYNLYEGHAKKGNDAEATKFLQESVKLETDQSEKAEKLLKLAKVYGSQKSYQKARSTAQQAAALRSGWGAPYLYIGDLYLSTSNSAGDDACSKKYGVWAAEDMFLKAKSIDSSVSSEADGKISTCKKYYPGKKDCFFIGIVEAGTPVTVGGWIGVETTARFTE